ncbi:hypothetical protein ELI_2586 [Eubacterium callanderi]|uniref:Uncharacterized protein n=1 Tax=Eubacterium callanderi TaxID=53442 RepID=E3GN73_9FIRM|nr:hypothetical protein ELI_2586 [Eubacterium callanderi]
MYSKKVLAGGFQPALFIFIIRRKRVNGVEQFWIPREKCFRLISLWAEKGTAS